MLTFTSAFIRVEITQWKYVPPISHKYYINNLTYFQVAVKMFRILPDIEEEVWAFLFVFLFPCA